jgi:hypothetical protein
MWQMLRQNMLVVDQEARNEMRDDFASYTGYFSPRHKRLSDIQGDLRTILYLEKVRVCQTLDERQSFASTILSKLFDGIRAALEILQTLLHEENRIQALRTPLFRHAAKLNQSTWSFPMPSYVPVPCA